MSVVFSKVRNLLNRHKNKLIITGTLIGGLVLASRYAQYKLREWQERETKEFLERTRKQQHFESTERTCNQTISSLSLALNNHLSRLLNTDECTKQLGTNPENRIELWNRFKALVFTHLSTLVYANVLLVIVLRVQLNLIGGYLYKDTKSVPTSLQQNYLSLCNRLLDDGLPKIIDVLQEKVNEIIGPMTLKKQLGLYDIEQIFWSMQTKLCESELDPIKHIREYIISDDVCTAQSTTLYNCMVRETADLLESDEVHSLATTCTNRCFSLIIDKLSEFYTVDKTSSDTFLHPSKVQIVLIKLLPVLNRLLSRNLLSDALIQQLILDSKVNTLAANIYEVFSHQ